MTKSTILLITVAALGLGSLIGVSLTDTKTTSPEVAAESGIKAAPKPPASRGGAPLFRYFGPKDVSTEYDEFGMVQPSVVGENFISQTGDPKTETITIRLEADAGTEYKALMAQGNAIVYSWATDTGQVYYDFHGHDESFGEEFFTRYAEGEGNTDSGMIVAPYGGQHGWYLLNLEGHPITVTLKVAGFYDQIIEIALAGE